MSSNRFRRAALALRWRLGERRAVRRGAGRYVAEVLLDKPERLVHFEEPRLQHIAVRHDRVTGRQQHAIPFDDLAGGDLVDAALAHDADTRLG